MRYLLIACDKFHKRKALGPSKKAGDKKEHACYEIDITVKKRLFLRARENIFAMGKAIC
jgi:hypothetical protein